MSPDPKCPECGEKNYALQAGTTILSGIPFSILTTVYEYHCICGQEYTDSTSERVKE